ncbi:MAG: hypothetical protein EXS49_00845 [Candidatus Pacebacteria bacterium]|nr:hypothetical protein [Candidatus Paceibacterota bacterium]
MNKKTILIIILILIAGGIFYFKNITDTSNQNTVNTENWKDYASPMYGSLIKVPQSWKITFSSRDRNKYETYELMQGYGEGPNLGEYISFGSTMDSGIYSSIDEYWNKEYSANPQAIPKVFENFKTGNYTIRIYQRNDFTIGGSSNENTYVPIVNAVVLNYQDNKVRSFLFDIRKEVNSDFHIDTPTMNFIKAILGTFKFKNK